jgi:succinoglycan biosynthesis protein ExoA
VSGAKGPATPAAHAPPASVTVAIPVLNERRHLGSCLTAIAEQTYQHVLEVLVVDGGSTDGTREIAAGFDRVRIVDNPRRSRPAGLNLAIAAACGDILVRVDARTLIAPDYVARCVALLDETGAAIVGGPMRFHAEGGRQRGIAAAMQSRLGAGPAAFRRDDPPPGLVDTVYLGAYRVSTIRSLGGYDEDFGGNEDAELNHRARSAGGVWLDPSIRSTYAVREDLRGLARQYRRYGRARAGTIRKHPASLAPRQLAVPALVLGLLSPARRQVATVYAAGVLGRAAVEALADPPASPALAVALPVMHGAWAVGFFERMLGLG